MYKTRDQNNKVGVVRSVKYFLGLFSIIKYYFENKFAINFFQYLININVKNFKIDFLFCKFFYF